LPISKKPDAAAFWSPSVFSAVHFPETWQTLYLPLITLQALSSMRIQTFNVGMLSTNCYVVNCPETKEAIIIDPGLDAAQETDDIVRYVDASALKVKCIVNTHGHSDHVSGDALLKKKYSVPICIHAYDAHCLNGLGEKTSPANILLKDKGLLKFGQITLEVMHTPGHTPGSICLVGENLVFTGDTLFAGGIGRTDFPGGSDSDMRLSLEKLLLLSDNCMVYPGHGGFSTIGEEKRFNPFLRWL
jgi:glyoxylase-like metal-dependent hydrolase (beta-lactamase superfamily II)